MKLVHTLLFMLRQSRDMMLAVNCLKTLEDSTYPAVVIYNQGDFTNEELEAFLTPFQLEFHIIGDGVNVGTAVGRQKCFDYIQETMPDTAYISELHLDMIFPPRWEDPLVDYLERNDEPLVSCGIVDQIGDMPFLDEKVTLPVTTGEYPDFLTGLRTDRIVHGFTNPCVHAADILKQTGGYNADFLKGRQCFEDDSMLLGYYYYYGTKRGWYPKVNYNSVVYHAVAAQRMTAGGRAADNYIGLVKQYGLMGLKTLSQLHSSEWHRKYFSVRYNEGINKD